MYTQPLAANYSSLADFLEQCMNTYADLPAFTALGQTLSYAQIDAYSQAFAAWLRQHTQLQPGDRIAVQLPNLIQNPIAVFGALRAGLVVVNTNPLYTEREMLHQFRDSGAKALVILDSLKDKFQAIRSQLSIETLVVTSPMDLIAGVPHAQCEDSISLMQTLELGAELELPPRPRTQPNDVCILQYTGGTTGVSKGAALSHNNILSNCYQTLDRLGASFKVGEEVVICPLPLYHIYAFTVCLVTFLSRGCQTILIPNPRDLDSFISTLKAHKFTTFTGINTLFIGLGRHPQFLSVDFSQLHLTLSGGTALTHSAVDAWQTITGCPITEGYGLSETSPVVAFNFPGQEQYGTVGPALMDTDIQILDLRGNPVTEGESGEIAVKGPQIMTGYWQRPDETAKVMSPQGYFKTGDVGVRTASGAIRIVDRIKDMILVSGFNVYPNEVEEVLCSYPLVLEAAVVGEPDDIAGERVCAYITVKSEPDLTDLQQHCRQNLVGYKVPKSIQVVAELPKSSVGKILRRQLRQ